MNCSPDELEKKGDVIQNESLKQDEERVVALGKAIFSRKQHKTNKN